MAVESYYDRTRREAKARLRAALNKPTPKLEYDLEDVFFNPWDDLMGGTVSPYNSEIDRLAIDVLEAIRDRTTFELLDGDRSLAAEIFMHMLAVWLCDYGTSPRGVFPRLGLEGMWQELIDKWRAWADWHWSDWQTPPGNAPRQDGGEGL